MTAWADDAAGREPDGRDPYVTLGVSPEASDADLRRAYRRLARLHHPDHNSGSQAAASRFAGIHAAYEAVQGLRRDRRRTDLRTDLRSDPTPSHPTPTHHPPVPDVGGQHPTSRSPTDPTSDSTDSWLQGRIAEVERDYERRRQSQGAAAASPTSPDPLPARRGSLRDRLTDWFSQG